MAARYAEFRARALAAMFGAGAVLGTIAASLQEDRSVDVGAGLALALGGVPFAVALAFVGARASGLVLHGLVVVGALLVAAGVEVGGGGPTSVASSMFFVWLALYSAWFFSARAMAVHLAIDALLLAIVLPRADVGGAASIWILVAGTTAVVGVAVSRMRCELLTAAATDPLTGLPTRSTLHEALARESARAARSSSPLCVAMIDVDDLKAVNDEKGHEAGDALLTDAAAAWRSALRQSDTLVRYGGDEFVAVLPDCTAADADAVAERARSAMAASCSWGLAWWHAGDAPADLLRRADVELYRAKRSRRAVADDRAADARPGSRLRPVDTALPRRLST